MLEVRTLDGRGFVKFLAAGTYFLRKYRGVMNDLNVFPVPDGDTGTNMYRTVLSALSAVRGRRGALLNEVAAAAAAGALLGARGNSGVISAQMLRGFAHAVRHRPHIDAGELAIALRDAVASARGALVRPVEGTIVTVAGAAADEAYRLAAREPELYRLLAGVVRAAATALDHTPEQLPALKEAGVVDSGGAGFVYFLEGVLRFLPEAAQRATAYPRRPLRQTAFTHQQAVGENKYCTEFVLEDAAIEAPALRELLERRGDSLLVAGGPPTLRVHVHTADAELVREIAAAHGRIERFKVDDMERQHRILVVDAPQKVYSILAVVPGLGFERIARELGADETLAALGGVPSVREIVLGINRCMGASVAVLANDANAVPAAREAVLLAQKPAIVVATRDMPSGLAVLLAQGGRPPAAPLPSAEELEAAGSKTKCAALFLAARASTAGGVEIRKGEPAAAIGGELFAGGDLNAVAESAARRLAGAEGGLLTLYYGGRQHERDALGLAETLRARLGTPFEVEWYFGGQRSNEYVMSFER